MLFEARALGKSFGAVAALRGVDLAVDLGEIVMLIGENGAGKSTLLSIICGLEAQDSGEIRVAGSSLAGAPAALRAIGMVFQQSTLDLELSLRQNLMFHAGLYGLDPRLAEARCRELLDHFDLLGRVDDKAGALSGGNRRRLELARALLHRPLLLLMDEPTAGLDPPSRRTLLDDVARLAREKKIGILWATHLLDEAIYADRIAVLHRGRILFDGPLAQMPGVAQEPLADAFLSLIASAP
ncbi:MAG TPA: ATP-binding cassette domain-containing protein [Roseiarcus sp.]|nr:ATP-binding cassette domain-containing protein [Roseiarcus sp.]